MRLTQLSKTVKLGLVTTGLAVLPFTAPTLAQTTTTDPGTGVNQPTTTTTYDEGGFDWGWLGLLGLIGLAGLAGKRDEHRDSSSYSDRPGSVPPGTSPPPTSRY
jgi:hypothetical protein